MNIILLDSSDWERAEANGVSRDEIRDCITDAAEEVAEILQLPEHLNITVRPHEGMNIIPETGEGGYTVDTELVSLSFDPGVPYGKETLMKSLRETVFHELNHVHRWMESKYDSHMLNSVVFEGLATTFADDYAGAESLWGKYDGEPVEEWLKELGTKTNAEYSAYFYRHPDGRRWMGYKVGSWLVREAMKDSGKTVVELTRMQWRELIELAGKTSLIAQ